MNADNRAARRRAGLVRARTAGLVSAAATAMVAGLAVAPSAQAITVDRDYTWDPVYASGLYAGLLGVIGNLLPGRDLQLADTLSFHTGPPASLGVNVSTSFAIAGAGITANVGLDLVLRSIAGSTKNLYNTVAGLETPGCGPGGASLTGGAPYASNCRYAVQLATLGSQLNLIDAYRGQIASVQGDTPAGLIPYESAPNSTSKLPTQTNQALVILENPLRPNGGIAARFPDISEALGIDPTMPAAGKVVSELQRIVLNTTTLDLTWAYDPIGDFPAVNSIAAVANSFAALLPLNIVTGGLAPEPLQGSSLNDVGLNLASLLQFPLNVTAAGFVNVVTLKMEDGQAFYSTLVPNELPITAALGLPATLTNFVLNAVKSPFLLGNPVGDVLAPAMRILVNTAYTDVLTPAKLATCATGCGTKDAKTWAQLGYQAYDRTYGLYADPGSVASAATPTPFGSVDPLTPEEEAAAKEAATEALSASLKEQFQKPFWGIVVPNEKTAQSAAAAPASAVKAAAATAAPEAVPPAPVAVPVVAPHVSAPEAPAAPAVPAAPTAPVVDVAPAVEISLPADDPGPADAPSVSRHRSSASSSSDKSNTSKAAASTGGHRGAD